MKKSLLSLLALVLGLAVQVNAQRHCASNEVHERHLKENPDYARRQAAIESATQRYLQSGASQRVSGGQIIIPCIVHVVYKNSTENISDAQVQSQIDRLNLDYGANNSDYNDVPSAFQGLRSGDTDIRFELIETKRYSDSRSSWGTNDAIKSAYPPIEPDRILNMWVGEIGGGILGYAQFPGGSSATDGVVMSPQYFGDASASGGSSFYLSAPFNLGRTATHEVGHWLNLRHIWGDGGCGASDFVDDTPDDDGPNYGTPSYPQTSCGTSDMFMNYMDYVDDAAMFMFSAGQDARMQATFQSGGGREGFLLDPVYTPGGGGGGGGGDDCTSTISAFPYSESFESGGVGSWSQGSGDDLDWTIDASGTPSSSTGPSAASDGTYYAYVEASSPNYPSKRTYLNGPCFDLSGESDATFEFDYHMYGAAMGTLTLEARTEGGDWTSVWSLSGDQGNAWNSASVDLGSYAGSTVQLRFNGLTGSSYTSDMTVDNLSFTTDGGSGGGGGGGSACSGGISSFPYGESFESGLGSWSQGSGDDLDWTRDASGTPSSGTGPSTGADGSYYMYIEASSPNYPSKTAYFNSPCFDLSGESSAFFNFEYHMNGTAMGTLALEASTDGGSTWTSVWNISGSQGDVWNSVSVDLASYTGSSVQLRFNGATGSSWSSDIAIDNVSVSASGSGGGGGGGSTSTVVLTLTTDNYGSETSWELRSGSTVLYSGSGYSNNTTYTETFTLADGCYDFVISDSYGDGICCSYGNGSYSLDEGSSNLASGGSFGSSETKNFCVSSSSRQAVAIGAKSFEMNMFPNPANVSTTVQVMLDQETDVNIQIFDMQGREVQNAAMQRVSGTVETTVDLKGLRAGIYLVSVTTGEGVKKTTKLVVE